jgi:hypothetical protein
MAVEIPGFSLTLEAAGDLSGQQYRFVKMSGTQCTVATGATDKTVGVLQNRPDAATRAATVLVSGVTKAVAGAAITAGAVLYIDASGRVTSTQASNTAVGVALSTVSNVGDLVTVLLRPLGAVA